MGRQIKTFLDNGLPIGFSNRMRGSSKREKRNAINDKKIRVRVISKKKGT